jgi:phosphatidylglycerophosphate synthase
MPPQDDARIPPGTPMRFAQLANAAGALTLARLPIAVAMPWLVYTPAALPAYLLAIATDVVDGVVARRTRTQSPAGAALDAWMDKILHVNLAWTLAVADRIPDVWMLAWFSRELLQIAMFGPLLHRFRTGKAPPPDTSRMGRVTAVVLFVAVVTVLLGYDATLATAAVGALGVATSAQYARTYLWGAPPGGGVPAGRLPDEA